VAPALATQFRVIGSVPPTDDVAVRLVGAAGVSVTVFEAAD
jgi:hypothetical protein